MKCSVEQSQKDYRNTVTQVSELKKKNRLQRIRFRVSPLIVGSDIHYTIGATTMATWQLIDVSTSSAVSPGDIFPFRHLSSSWLNAQLIAVT